MDGIKIKAVKTTEFSEAGEEAGSSFGFIVDTDIGCSIATGFNSFNEVKEALSAPNIGQTLINHFDSKFLDDVNFFYEDKSEIAVEVFGKKYLLDELFPVA